MLNPRHNPDGSDEIKDQGIGEETEYHFSEDEFTYQVESDMKSADKQAAATSSSTQGGMQKRFQDMKERVSGLKKNRLPMIVGGVLVLIALIYKMISPSSKEMPGVVMVQNVSSARTMTAANTSSSMLSQPAIIHKEQIQPANASSTAPMPVQSGAPASQPTPTDLQNSSTHLAPVMPVEGQSIATKSGVVPASQVESKLSQVNQSNEAMLNQMQAEYLQKLNDYAAQNKNLTDEVKTLTNRISALESELNQLLQALMKTNIAAQVSANSPPDVQNTETTPSQTSEVRLPYTVQAIIPGRAWLRSESGETLTVSEGDNLKEGGRVSKIDPYDGIVEITIGKKTVALSYGNNEQP